MQKRIDSNEVSVDEEEKEVQEIVECLRQKRWSLTGRGRWLIAATMSGSGQSRAAPNGVSTLQF